MRGGPALPGPQTGERMGSAAPAEPSARSPAGLGGARAAVPGRLAPAEAHGARAAPLCARFWVGSEGLGGKHGEVVSEFRFPPLENGAVPQPHRDARGSIKAPTASRLTV